MSDTFHLLGSFPYDIRRLIYAAYLSEQRHRIFHFGVGSSDHDRSRNHRLEKLYSHPPLGAAVATRPSRTLSAVSREARLITHSLLPDTLEFYVHLKKPSDRLGRTTSVSEPRVLRFDGSRNIISIEATHEERRALLALTDPSRPQKSPFSGIRHLAMGMLLPIHPPIHVCPKLCAGPECAESCEAGDNLPRFLGLFPDLTNLYLADVRAQYYGLSRDGCFCEPRVSGTGTGATSSARHTWPVVRGPDDSGDIIHKQWPWFAIRGEPGDCPFMLPVLVDTVRKTLPGSRFPYYPRLSHLKIQYLQPLPHWEGPDNADDKVGELVMLRFGWNGWSR